MLTAYETRSARIGQGSEAFSLIRTSSLAADKYIKRFFATGTEHQQPEVVVDAKRSNGRNNA